MSSRAPSMPPFVKIYRAWIQALLGGTMISYAWAMAFVVAVPLRRREPWAAWAIVVATLNWFIVDTSLSAAHGAVMVPWLRRRA